jgi:hypothetical protein
MPRIAFDQLPEDGRIWIFPLSRPLSDQEEEELLRRVDEFLDGWAAHGTPLTAGRDWREGSFLLIGVDESSAPPSGCSIDAMARVLEGLGADWGVSFLDHGPVWFRDGNGVRRVSRGEFKEMAEREEVTLDTVVFDNSITRLFHLRSGEWERPAAVSWHRRAFFPAVAPEGRRLGCRKSSPAG